MLSQLQVRVWAEQRGSKGATSGQHGGSVNQKETVLS